MFDPILKKSIQRWEYEGGSVLTTPDRTNVEAIERNKVFRSWKERNHAESEAGIKKQKSPRNQPESAVDLMA